MARFDCIKEVRGLGLFNAFEFQAPQSALLRMLFKGLQKIHPGLFGQMITKTLFEEAHILSQMAGNNYLVIKSLPPLVISIEQMNEYIDGVERVCKLISGRDGKFWTQGLKIGARAVGSLSSFS